MKLASIQSLRALAALVVMVGHLRSIEEKHSGELPLLPQIWVNGASGVDLFFVISGFIMIWVSGDAERGLGSAGRFLYSRVTRIYPLWWLFASAMATYFFIAYGVPWDAENLALFQITGPDHLLKSYALLPQATFPVLGVGWTLVHEMYFYAGFALLLFLPASWRVFGLLLWGAGVTAGSLLGLSAGFAGTLVQLAFYPMTLEFIMGAGVALAIRAGWTRFSWLTLGLGVLGFVTVFLTFDFVSGGAILSVLGIENAPGYTLGWGRTLFFGIPAAFIVHGLVGLEVRHGFGRYIPKLAVHIGDWSYALYLCHMLVLSAVARIFFGLFSRPGPLDNLAFLIVSGIASIIVAALTYFFIEKPLLGGFHTLRGTLFRPRRQPS